ncbi:MAG: hypothetical protein WC979_00460 [Candidatus Pacearchaeota archaeon]|jgi:hypothetical protein
MFLTFIYSICGILHGAFALGQQSSRHPHATELWRMILVYVINLLFWPITLPWGLINIYRENKNKTSK